MHDKATEVGRRIRLSREAKGWTQRELGDRLNMSTTSISRYEQGLVHDIKLPIMESLSKILDVNLDYLLLTTDDPTRNYYYSEETQQIMDDVFHNPRYKMLLDAPRTLKEDQLNALIDLVESMVKNNE